MYGPATAWQCLITSLYTLSDSLNTEVKSHKHPNIPQPKMFKKMLVTKLTVQCCMNHFPEYIRLHILQISKNFSKKESTPFICEGLNRGRQISFDPSAKVKMFGSIQYQTQGFPLVIRFSGSGDPPWILKWGGLESSGQRLISLNS